ncbi:undecaprenyl/decaprenyl-phosphate alpha-N-acetylglucosaminyl 1-phosphate transferase [Candidatus Falkowbacteria bacterium]|nr:undecaprenyl/decaprenyl-phosphate alpha-N-acetylglucosaminyl 1-phosphate transferase [Candidatus Falkowbacteria bacterium]
MFSLQYFLAFLSSFILTAVLTVPTIWLAKKMELIDQPSSERKIHRQATPLFGGLAIFVSFFALVYLFRSVLLVGNLEPYHYFGFFVGSLFLMIGGFLDDKFNLRPAQQLMFPILAIAALIAGGVHIDKITNPAGGYIYLGYWSSLLISLWLIGMMYTTKLLDGVDGLVTGVVGIGGLVIFLFTSTTRYYQPDIALASLLLAGACAGFLVFNWHPAKIFLGEGGSLLLGYILGVLAIISGGKIAVALLVMGIPVLDVVWTILRRLAQGKNPFKFADRKHLHHRLLDLGLGQRKTVLVFYAFALFFGLSGLFLQSLGKVYALAILLVIMLGLVIGFSQWDKKKNDTTPTA